VVLRVRLRQVAITFAFTLTSACSLYFESSPDETPPDAGPGADSGPHPDTEPPLGQTMARCEDGKLYKVAFDPFAVEFPGHGQGTQFAQCAGACRSAAAVCSSEQCLDAPAELCDAEPARGKSCSFEGSSCSGTSTLECPQATTCGYSVPGSTCTCVAGAYDCTPRTPIAQVHSQLVGKWRGTVSPPEFTSAYEVSLWIYPDGTYWAECDDDPFCVAFYYGGDGPHPDRRLSVLSTSPTEGAWADINVFNGDPVGALTSLVVDATRLHFTYFASWHNCGQPFVFDLMRE